MRKILFILACVATVATSASAHSIKKKDSDCDDSRNIWRGKASEIIQKAETALFKYIYARNPSTSISVSGLLDIPIKTLHMLHKPCDSERILKSIGLEDVEQAIRISRFIVDQMAQSNNVFQNYVVYADDDEEFTNTFNNNLADVCRGVTKYIDFNNNTEADSYIKKWYSSPENKDVGIRDSCFKRNGVVFSGELKLIANLDNNIASTLINTYLDYHSNNGIVSQVPAFSGEFEVFYLENNRLKAQFVKISINNGDAHVILGLPQNREDLPFVVEILNNNTKRNILISSMKRIHVRITSVVGAAFMRNNLKQYFTNEGLNLNGIANVLKGTRANVNAIFQDINISLKHIQSQDNVHSSQYRGSNKCTTNFVIDRAVAYKMMLHDIPFGFGVYDYNEHGEFQ